MLNKIFIMGRLTRDPEMRMTQKNVKTASFTLAVDRDFQQGGERKTDFIDCVAWRNTAEFVEKYFSKGSMAVVCGRLQLRDWTGDDGIKRRAAEISVENIYFGESKHDKPAASYSAPAHSDPYEDILPQDFEELDADDLSIF